MIEQTAKDYAKNILEDEVYHNWGTKALIEKAFKDGAAASGNMHFTKSTPVHTGLYLNWHPFYGFKMLYVYESSNGLRQRDHFTDKDEALCKHPLGQWCNLSIPKV